MLTAAICARFASTARESFTHEFWVPDGSALYYVEHKENDPQRYLYSADPQRWKTAS
jgi:Tol biopolymer transport system component